MICFLLLISFVFSESTSNTHTILCMDNEVTEASKCQNFLEVSNIADNQNSAKCIKYGNKYMKVYTQSVKPSTDGGIEPKNGEDETKNGGSETKSGSTDGKSGSTDGKSESTYRKNFRNNWKKSIKGEEPVTITYHIKYYNNNDCTGNEVSDITVVPTKKPSNIVITIPVEESKDSDKITYTQYVAANVCVNNKIFVNTQFGVAQHKCTNDNEYSELEDIITDKFNGMTCIIQNKVDITDKTYTTSTTASFKKVQSVNTQYTITDGAKIVEMTSPDTGKIYTCTKGTSSIIICTKDEKQDSVTVLNTNGNIATGALCNTNKCEENNGKAYFFDTCESNMKYLIAGSLFQQFEYNENTCDNFKQLKLSSTSDKHFTIGSETYLLTFNPIESTETIYTKTSDIEYKTYVVGSCHKTGETSSKKVVKTSENKYVIENFNDVECKSAGSVVKILTSILTTVPVQNATVTLIESDIQCTIKKVSDAVISTNIKLDTCADTFKYVIEKGVVTKYTFKSNSDCLNSKDGVVDQTTKHTCNKCDNNVETICPMITDNNSNNDEKPNNNLGDSTSIMFIGIALIITIFF
ncbi:hypothetical protein EHI_065890 [Entamoeba histolytica HM-1:IMSS]|uniref:Uncharacterized protein n=1 Tax=Entamoeba histolytica (strain ATCC 30459 / HM-1:IMSS / ABRM) TaxID=294381 RepID=C4M005_ENTH1|nr:hypothetical protein EHI_065890 [Entamoeba histolytica HM-1:IMSS]EAL48280.2 hypothetical protein EHI_065890 [Entamoeba histolytica HM-1:IMSS]|eukprot:XP_653666.2 hypothetical protein EHI_065890 [Entamoeba histolytica HM-1:IMSS]